MIKPFGVYHYNAHSAIVECANLFATFATGKLAPIFDPDLRCDMRLAWLSRPSGSQRLKAKMGALRCSATDAGARWTLAALSAGYAQKPGKNEPEPGIYRTPCLAKARPVAGVAARRRGLGCGRLGDETGAYSAASSGEIVP